MRGVTYRRWKTIDWPWGTYLIFTHGVTFYRDLTWIFLLLLFAPCTRNLSCLIDFRLAIFGLGLIVVLCFFSLGDPAVCDPCLTSSSRHRSLCLCHPGKIGISSLSTSLSIFCSSHVSICIIGSITVTRASILPHRFPCLSRTSSLSSLPHFVIWILIWSLLSIASSALAHPLSTLHRMCPKEDISEERHSFSPTEVQAFSREVEYPAS